MVIFVVIGDGTGSFKTVNLELFKLKKEKLFVLISITWYTDTLVNLELFKLKKEKLFVLISITWYTDTLIPEVSYEPNFVGTRNLNLEIF